MADLTIAIVKQYLKKKKNNNNKKIAILGPLSRYYRDSIGCTWRCRWRCQITMFASCMVNHVRSVIAILQCDVAHSTRSSFPIDYIAPLST